jgi:hypothetical protein
MSFLDYFKSLKAEHRVAWTVAIAADALQIFAFPFFAEGALAPADSTAAAKLLPVGDLFPTWTAAVWFVTRRRLSGDSSPSADSTPVSGEPEILPPGPAPEPRR